MDAVPLAPIDLLLAAIVPFGTWNGWSRGFVVSASGSAVLVCSPRTPFAALPASPHTAQE